MQREDVTTGPRAPETGCLTMGSAHAEEFDRMQALLRAKGWLGTGDLLRNGIMEGLVLEAGAGPGHLGLDWLLRTEGTRLVGLDLNPDMVAIADRRLREAGLAGRARHLVGSAEAIPFGENTFDALFSCHSLHEWSDPCAIFAEFWRVLRPGGRLYVYDLRRDLSATARVYLERWATSDAVLKGIRASLDAAYTTAEVEALLGKTACAGCGVIDLPLGLRVTGTKAI